MQTNLATWNFPAIKYNLRTKLPGPCGWLCANWLCVTSNHHRPFFLKRKEKKRRVVEGELKKKGYQIINLVWAERELSEDATCKSNMALKESKRKRMEREKEKTHNTNVLLTVGRGYARRIVVFQSPRRDGMSTGTANSMRST